MGETGLVSFYNILWVSSLAIYLGITIGVVIHIEKINLNLIPKYLMLVFAFTFFQIKYLRVEFMEFSYAYIYGNLYNKKYKLRDVYEYLTKGE